MLVKGAPVHKFVAVSPGHITLGMGASQLAHGEITNMAGWRASDVYIDPDGCSLHKRWSISLSSVKSRCSTGNYKSLQLRHIGRDGVSNPQLHHCLLRCYRLFRCRSKKRSKLRVTGLCVGNSPVTGEFPAHRVSNAENVSIWWRHHVMMYTARRIQI